MNPMILNYKDHVRGDTIRLRTFELLIDAVPKNIVSARMFIRGLNDALIYQIPVIVSGNMITQPSIDGDITKNFPVFLLRYDIEFTLDSGLVRTYLAGTINILKDVSYE